MTDLSILTVNYNSASWLLEAQRALAASMPACSFEWIVANHSPEDPVTTIPALAGHMRVFEESNVGFGRGVNAAARIATAPILFLANPDLQFDGALLDGGLETLAADPKVGLLGPRLLNMTDGYLQRTARRFYTWPAALFARIPGREHFPAPRFWRHHLMIDDTPEQPTDVDWVLGAAMFVRRAALRDPSSDEPVFDPRYFLYFDDVDLCMDLWSRGWRVRYDPRLTARHAHVRASRHLWSPAARKHASSFLKFAMKWKGLPQRPAGRRSAISPD